MPLAGGASQKKSKFVILQDNKYKGKWMVAYTFNYFFSLYTHSCTCFCLHASVNFTSYSFDPRTRYSFV